MLQFVFLRHFYDKDGRVNTKNKWVWTIHAINYPYILYIYFFTDAVKRDSYATRKIWIPLDIVLTVNITLYQVFYHFMEKLERDDGGKKLNDTDGYHDAESALSTNDNPLLINQDVDFDPAKFRTGLRKLIGDKRDKEEALKLDKAKDLESGKELSSSAVALESTFKDRLK